MNTRTPVPPREKSFPPLRTPGAELINKFLNASEESVIEFFSKMPDAKTIPVPGLKTPAVYVPGNHPTPVLLVAHTDTVRGDPAPPLINDGPFWFASTENSIGADDRLGCCALSTLRPLGHPLLLCPAEETGCVGSRHVASVLELLVSEQLLPDPSTLRFLLQFDRRGSLDLAHYDHISPEFRAYLGTMFPHHSIVRGTCTDIARLCPAFGLCGINISVGYYNEHTTSELYNLTEFQECLRQADRLLARTDIPRFAFEPPTYHSLRDDDDDDHTGRWWERNRSFPLHGGGGQPSSGVPFRHLIPSALESATTQDPEAAADTSEEEDEVNFEIEYFTNHPDELFDYLFKTIPSNNKKNTDKLTEEDWRRLDFCPADFLDRLGLSGFDCRCSNPKCKDWWEVPGDNLTFPDDSPFDHPTSPWLCPSCSSPFSIPHLSFY